MKNVSNLAGSNYAVYKNYLSEIRIAHKKLWSAYKKYRNRVHLRYPAARVVNDSVVDDEFQGWDKKL